MLLRLRLHLRHRFAKGIAIRRIVSDAVPQVVEQHADFPKVVRVDHHHMDARPIQIRFRRRLARDDANPVDLECGEECDQPALEGRRHLRRIALEEQARERDVHLRRDRSLIAEHQRVAVAPFGERSRGIPAARILENQDAHRQRSGQFRLTENLCPSAARNCSKRTIASRPLRGPASVIHFKRTPGEFHPVIIRREEAGIIDSQSSRRIHLHYLPASKDARLRLISPPLLASLNA